ncbi:MAG: GTPase ObgE [Cyanobacteria bacterium]|nr:GTPase ObgE [Cyanobacteriota bacterium]MDA1020399.1 GTPase ObgE [Cyanobacteriota bacterium]
MFIDKVTIKLASGRGGHGASSFRQEKFVANGGPDGGDGGRGASIWLEATHDLSTLLDFKFKAIYKADNGKRGGRSNKTGPSGEDYIIKVPLGTVVKDPNAELIIGDLTYEGQRLLVAEGGRGGRGNTKFKSNKTKVPNFSEPGEAGIERELELELKMIADVGIIGFPNAGKSTLISKVSSSKAKIADYAFTTIMPNLGVVRKESGDAYVMADIPGLIEGASEGHGLGHEFLRHVERTRLLIHMVDVWGLMGSNLDEFQHKNFENPLHNFIQVNYELYNYSPELAKRKQIVVLNKIEGYPEDELAKVVKDFEEQMDPDVCLKLFTVSAFTGQGLTELRRYIEQALEEIPKETKEVLIDYDPIATDHDDSNFQIIKQDQSDKTVKWLVHCGKLERHMKLVNLKEPDSLYHIFRVTKGLGVIDAIKSKGAKDGDSLNIDGVDFEVNDALLI